MTGLPSEEGSSLCVGAGSWLCVAGDCPEAFGGSLLIWISGGVPSVPAPLGAAVVTPGPISCVGVYSIMPGPAGGEVVSFPPCALLSGAVPELSDACEEGSGAKRVPTGTEEPEDGGAAAADGAEPAAVFSVPSR